MKLLQKLVFLVSVWFWTGAAWALPLDINAATADEIATNLVGIGKAKAAAIVQDREKNGPFGTVDDLARVKGIGAKTIAKNRDKMTVGGAAPAPAAPTAPAKVSAPAAAAPASPKPADVPVAVPAVPAKPKAPASMP